MYNHGNFINTNEVIYDDNIIRDSICKNKDEKKNKNVKGKNILINTNEIIYNDMFKQ